ncbi:hypothetical protein [Hydrogenimonas sp.]
MPDAIGFSMRPRPKRNQSFVHELVASIPECPAIEAWHESFDTVEPPAGKPVTVAGKHQEEIQPDFFGLHHVEYARAAQTVIEPCKRARYSAQAIRFQNRQRTRSRHDKNPPISVAFHAASPRVMQTENAETFCPFAEPYPVPSFQSRTKKDFFVDKIKTSKKNQLFCEIQEREYSSGRRTIWANPYGKRYAKRRNMCKQMQRKKIQLICKIQKKEYLQVG